jgi:hypothetical protein
VFGCGCGSGMLCLAWLPIYLILLHCKFLCGNVEVLCGLDELLKLEGKCVVGWGIV